MLGIDTTVVNAAIQCVLPVYDLLVPLVLCTVTIVAQETPDTLERPFVTVTTKMFTVLALSILTQLETNLTMSTSNDDPRLMWSPLAWLKINRLMRQNNTEVGALAVTQRNNPLYILDLLIPTQQVSGARVEFDDDSIGDINLQMAQRGYTVEQYMRIWIHTHPGTSTTPSSVDEDTFRNRWAQMPYAMMVIVGYRGTCYCRLSVRAPFPYVRELPSEIDWDAKGYDIPEDLDEWAEKTYKEKCRPFVHTPTSSVQYIGTGSTHPRMPTRDQLYDKPMVTYRLSNGVVLIRRHIGGGEFIWQFETKETGGYRTIWDSRRHPSVLYPTPKDLMTANIQSGGLDQLAEYIETETYKMESNAPLKLVGLDDDLFESDPQKRQMDHELGQVVDWDKIRREIDEEITKRHGEKPRFGEAPHTQRTIH